MQAGFDLVEIYSFYDYHIFPSHLPRPGKPIKAILLTSTLLDFKNLKGILTSHKTP